MLELINRGRRNPEREGRFLYYLETDYARDAKRRKPEFFSRLLDQFERYPAVPPLAFHPILLEIAGEHSADMIERDYYRHNDLEGRGPSRRAKDAGYPDGVGENLSGAGAQSRAEVLENHYGLMVDCDNASPGIGHRLNLLDADYREVGIGIRGPYYGGHTTQDFGDSGKRYLLGVAYSDKNRNGFYEPGEGLKGIRVSPDFGRYYAVTSASGGYAIPITFTESAPEEYEVPFPVKDVSYSEILPYAKEFESQQIAKAGTVEVRMTWSGGPLTASKVTRVTIARPLQIKYKVTGTDGYYYSFTMVTSDNTKVDLVR